MTTPVDLAPVLIEEFNAWVKIMCCEAAQAQFGPLHEADAHKAVAAMAQQWADRIAKQLEEGHA